MKTFFQQLIYKILQPLVNFSVRFKISPNIWTTVGLLLSIFSTSIFIFGAETAAREEFQYLLWGGAFILIGGVFDMVDGQVARHGNMETKFGAMYDSVMDRYSELIMFFGISYFLISHDYFFSSLASFVALVGSIMVSYVRARAEGMGIECAVGFMQRPERVVTIGVSAFICGLLANWIDPTSQLNILGIDFELMSVFTIPVFFVAIMANITAIHRLIHCYNQCELEEKNAKK